MISRVKQIWRYLFYKFDENCLKEIKEVLYPKEYEIFLGMQDYDKLHSYLIYSKVKKDSILRKDEKYMRLALLHDCGKGRVTLFRRVKKVVFGDKILEQHPEIAYNKLKNIDLEVAILCRDHHKKMVDENMKRFQKIDDE